MNYKMQYARDSKVNDFLKFGNQSRRNKMITRKLIRCEICQNATEDHRITHDSQRGWVCNTCLSKLKSEDQWIPIDSQSEINQNFLKIFKNYLISLDQLLTGRPRLECVRTSDQFTDLYQFMGGYEYYLSNGGYSRIFLDIYSNQIFLSVHSLDYSKNRWKSEQVQDLINGLKKHISIYLISSPKSSM